MYVVEVRGCFESERKIVLYLMINLPQVTTWHPSLTKIECKINNNDDDDIHICTAMSYWVVTRFIIQRYRMLVWWTYLQEIILLVVSVLIMLDLYVVCSVRVHSVILVIISLLFGLFVIAIGCDQVGVLLHVSRHCYVCICLGDM